MTSTKIVVARTTDYMREEIARSRSPESPNHVYLTGNPYEVIRRVSEEDIDVVVTGQRFYHQCVMESGWIDGGLVDATLPGVDISRIMDGNKLATKIRELKPSILVLRHSVWPESTQGFDGDIPRKELAVLIDLLDDRNLGEFVRTQNFEGLRKRFPQIQWYQRE